MLEKHHQNNGDDAQGVQTGENQIKSVHKTPPGKLYYQSRRLSASIRPVRSASRTMRPVRRQILKAFQE